MKKIICLFLYTAVALTFSSCGEKYDESEDLLPTPSTPDYNDEWDKPTSDGIVQESGAVDLGLSVKWASCDLSENTENHFAESCKESGSKFKWATEYISDPPAEIGGTIFDNATALLGNGWRTPTKSECEELIEKCRFHYTVYKDAVGYIVTGKNNKAIFINTGYYFTSSFMSSKYFYLNITSSYKRMDYYYYYNSSNTAYIRPVYTK